MLLAVAASGHASAQESESICGSLANGNGPFDYRSQRAQLVIVEQYHFTPQVETLRSGQSGAIGGDLDYTLRASPNHHRALLALVRLAEKTKQPQPAGLPRDIDCYFDRALRFRKDDTVARMIFAKHLINTGREAQARQQLQATEQFAGDNGLTHYNLGLLYTDLKAWEQALAQAHKAQALGYTDGTLLRERLQAAGRWQEPVVPAASQPTATQPVSEAASAPPISQDAPPDASGTR